MIGGAILALSVIMICHRNEDLFFEMNLEALIQTENPFMDKNCFLSYEESSGSLAVEVVTCDSCEKRWVSRASKPSECWSGN